MRVSSWAYRVVHAMAFPTLPCAVALGHTVFHGVMCPQVKDQFNPRSEHLYCIKTLDINATGRSVPYPAPYYCQSKGQQKRRGRELSVEALKRQYDQQGVCVPAKADGSVQWFWRMGGALSG